MRKKREQEESASSSSSAVGNKRQKLLDNLNDKPISPSRKEHERMLQRRVEMQRRARDRKTSPLNPDRATATASAAASQPDSPSSVTASPLAKTVESPSSVTATATATAAAPPPPPISLDTIDKDVLSTVTLPQLE